MADRMQKKVAQAISRKRNDFLSDELLARAALEACHLEELVTALRVAWNALDSAEPFIEPGAPPEEIDHYTLSPIAYASAISFVKDALAKVEASDA